jgi:hypothetical protein
MVKVHEIPCKKVMKIHHLRASSTTRRPKIPKREYFYEIDHHGQLFLAETKHKNFTSCFKDKAFLDFFYSRLVYNDQSNPFYPEFQYKSLCGPEVNYVRAEDAPVVFHTLHNDNLVFAGTFTFKFSPAAVHVSKSTWRFYHPLPQVPREYPSPCTRDGMHIGLGLLKSQLVLNHLYEGFSDEGTTIRYRGAEYPFVWID